MLRCERYLGGETLGRRHAHGTRYETDLARDEDAFVYLDTNKIGKGGKGIWRQRLGYFLFTRSRRAGVALVLRGWLESMGRCLLVPSSSDLGRAAPCDRRLFARRMRHSLASLAGDEEGLPPRKRALVGLRRSRSRKQH